MSYFIPSFFQKRLLRYALSRLEIVDTDALDLDSLGITWGQRSTFELRDVGLRLEVCEQLYILAVLLGCGCYLGCLCTMTDPGMQSLESCEDLTAPTGVRNNQSLCFDCSCDYTRGYLC